MKADIYRPPSEAYSLLVQVTIGCTHNKCTFCRMFKNKKFRVRRAGRSAGRSGVGKGSSISSVPRIFLCDGDAMALSNARLMPILELHQRKFPGMRESVYLWQRKRHYQEDG